MPEWVLSNLILIAIKGRAAQSGDDVHVTCKQMLTVACAPYAVP